MCPSKRGDFGKCTVFLSSIFLHVTIHHDRLDQISVLSTLLHAAVRLHNNLRRSQCALKLILRSIRSTVQQSGELAKKPVSLGMDDPGKQLQE